MKIRFRETWPSSNPHCPFQAGQVITVDAPTPDMLLALRNASAEVLREDEPELAVMGQAERAVTRRPRKGER